MFRLSTVGSLFHQLGRERSFLLGDWTVSDSTIVEVPIHSLVCSRWVAAMLRLVRDLCGRDAAWSVVGVRDTILG